MPTATSWALQVRLADHETSCFLPDGVAWFDDPDIQKLFQKLAVPVAAAPQDGIVGTGITHSAKLFTDSFIVTQKTDSIYQHVLQLRTKHILKADVTSTGARERDAALLIACGATRCHVISVA